jgi:LemA protein
MNKWITPAIIVLVIIVIVAWAAGSYNGLVNSEEKVNNAWAQVETMYQRRADLIPNLESVVFSYADFERQTLTDVVEARAKATSVNINPQNLDANSLQQFQAAQDQFSSALGRLMVVVERYPDLKANENFRDFQVQLEGSENRISTARTRYNDTASEFNAMIRRFPRNLFASNFGFERKPYFESQPGAETAPRVNRYGN